MATTTVLWEIPVHDVSSNRKDGALSEGADSITAESTFIQVIGSSSSRQASPRLGILDVINFWVTRNISFLRIASTNRAIALYSVGILLVLFTFLGLSTLSRIEFDTTHPSCLRLLQQISKNMPLFFITSRLV